LKKRKDAEQDLSVHRNHEWKLKIMENKIGAPLFLMIWFLSVSNGAAGFERVGVLCFEMGAEVAYYFIKGKVIRYSAFHAFSPPTKLQKQLYGNYSVQGGLIEWRDEKTRVHFSYDTRSKKVATNKKWNAASPCEEVSLAQIKEHFLPILERNRSLKK